MSPPNNNQTNLGMPLPNNNPSPRTDHHNHLSSPNKPSLLSGMNNNNGNMAMMMAINNNINNNLDADPTPTTRNGNIANGSFLMNAVPPPFLNNKGGVNSNSGSNNNNGALNNNKDNHHSPNGPSGMNHSSHSLRDSLGGSFHSLTGDGGADGAPGGGGVGPDGNPTTARLDAMIRDLSRRRMVMAQQAAATASAVAAASGGGAGAAGAMERSAMDRLSDRAGGGGVGPGGGMGPPGMGGGPGGMGMSAGGPGGMGGVGMGGPGSAMERLSERAMGGGMAGMGARSSVAASAMGIKTDSTGGVGGPSGMMGGGGGTPGKSGNLADYAGTAADSFAQAFVDRWASAHSKDPTGGVPMTAGAMAAAMGKAAVGGSGGQPLTNNSYHSLTSEGSNNNNNSNSGPNNPNNLAAARRSSDSQGSVGGGGSSKQWWVCDFCKNKAFISRVELKEHEQFCEMNPMKTSGAGPGGDKGSSSGIQVTALSTGGGSGGKTAAEKAMLSNSMHSMGTISRGGSLGSSHHSMSHGVGHHPGMAAAMGGHPGMMPGMRGPGPAGAGGGWMPPPGMNPYAMGMMCGDASSMMMNPHHPAFNSGMAGMGSGANMGHHMGGGMPNMAEAAAQAAAAQQPSRRKSSSAPIITPEVIEASKGPFRQLPKPLALALDEDKDWLTPLHCFVRKHCVEVFTATEMDVQTPSKGKRKPIQVGQIGIRCAHCHAGRKDTDPNRERGSVYYPTSLSSIYNATMNLLQRHLHSCPKVALSIMEKYTELKKDDARSGTSKKYWIESAKSLGFVDTLQGIKLSAKQAPPPPSTSVSQQQTKEARGRSESYTGDSEVKVKKEEEEKAEGEAKKEDDKEKDEKEGDDDKKVKEEVKEDDNKEGGDKDEKSEDGEEKDGDKDEDEKEEGDGGKDKKEKKDDTPAEAPPLVIPADKSTATAFSFFLLSQMQPCVFTEADRLGKRKGLPTGFAGLACRHCFGGYGSGRFFPSSIKTLSDTSKTLNVLHNHMSRCRKVPKEIIEELEVARSTHDEERAKMKFGSQKAFFAKIWSRLHDNRPDGAVIKPPPRKPQNPSSNGGVRRLSSTGSMGGQGGPMMLQRWGSGAMGGGMNGMMNPAMMGAMGMPGGMGGMGGMGAGGMAGMGGMMPGMGGMPQNMMQHQMMMMGGGPGPGGDPQHMMAAQMGQMGGGAGMAMGMGGMGGMPMGMMGRGGMGMGAEGMGAGHRGSMTMGGGAGADMMGGSSHSMGGSNHGNMGGAGMDNKRQYEMLLQENEMRKRMRSSMPPNNVEL